MSPAVFLDRDGVVNRGVVRDGKPYPPQTLADFELLPKVPEGIELLRQAGFKIVIATNQPDVATGKQTLDVVKAMHAKMSQQIHVDSIKVCYHVDADQCECRKPKPGMLLEAANELGIDLKKSFMIGDRWRDIDAGKAAGCQTIWIRSEYKEKAPEGPSYTCDSVFEAAKWILSQKN